MTWEEKFEACQILGEISLHMRKPGDWYVNHLGVSRHEGSILSGGCVLNASCPEVAVNKHWDWLTDPKYYIVTKSYDGGRAAFRWNRYMWKKVDGKYREFIEGIDENYEQT